MLARRREFLIAGAVLGMSGVAGAAETQAPTEDVSAVEDLMREHGVLRRILLVYEECLRKSDEKTLDADFDMLRQSAELIKEFIEDYHEFLEETFIFPEFEKRKELVGLVGILKEQHAAGRKWTSRVLATAKQGRTQGIERPLKAFIRMYRPHAAHEDTVLFPALKKLLSARQLDKLGDKFEEEENRRFGQNGFEKTVNRVATIEERLGIHDLSKFTVAPKENP
jgi:hemerythrin-like domain-containing protein